MGQHQTTLASGSVYRNGQCEDRTEGSRCCVTVLRRSWLRVLHPLDPAGNGYLHRTSQSICGLRELDRALEVQCLWIESDHEV